jgi:tetratricopeptide (TPR) repeat protein
MSWLAHHIRSEEYASQAQELDRQQQFDRAVEFYYLAADAEAHALEHLDPYKTRTLGITAVSAASLYYKAQEFEQAKQVIHKYLATNSLPSFAVDELNELLREIQQQASSEPAANGESASDEPKIKWDPKATHTSAFRTIGNAHKNVSQQIEIIQSGNFGIGHMNGGMIAPRAKVAGIINEAEQQNLAEAAAEIQQLLEQLEQSYPANTTTGTMQIATETISQIDRNPTLKARILNALKAGGVAAFEQFLNHPAASFVIAALEEWQTHLPG